MDSEQILLEQRDINRIRHPKERIFYFVSAFINTAVILFLVMAIFIIPRDILFSQRSQQVYIAIATLFVLAFFSMGSTFAQTKVYSVRIDENQFPELYDIVRDYAKILGLRKTPYIYIRQSNGVLNAFAAYFWGRNYVLINTEIFEIAYLEHKDIDAVSFIIAHEMTHIRLHHTRFWYNASILISKLIPILGPALSRAQEYSCDRVAMKICPQGKHGIFMLLLGRHLYKNVNIEEYIKQAEDTEGIFEVVINANATHPVNTRRIVAIYKPEKAGKLLF